MQTNFIQPGGNTTIQSSGEVFSQLLNIPYSNIGALEVGRSLTEYSFAVHPESKEIFNTTAITGKITGVSVTGTVATIVTDAGSFTAPALPSALTTISVATIADLRKFEPWFEGQHVVLERAIADGPAIYADVTYDSADTSTTDDDYRILVTAKGARWVVECPEGVDIRLAGLNKSGSNFGSCANKIIKGEVKKIVDTNTSFIRAHQIILVPHPTYVSRSASYTIDEKITIPSFMGFQGTGWIDLRTSLTTTAVHVRNDTFPGLTFNMGGYVSIQGFGTFNNANGKFRLLGPGSDTSQGAGIEIGTDTMPATTTSEINVRDLNIQNLHVSGFKYGIAFNGFDTYIITVSFSDFSRNQYGVAGININKQNSGERILFKSCTIGSKSHNIYWNLVGWNLTFDNCSIDYAGGAMLCLDNGARGCVFRFTNGTFIEGFGSNLISQLAYSTSWTYDNGRKNKVDFENAFINAQGVAGVFSSRRQVIAAASDMLACVNFTNTDFRWPDEDSGNQISLLGYNDLTSTYVTVNFVNCNTVYDQCLAKYGDSLNAGLFRFSGTAGAALTKDTNTNLSFTTSGTGTIVYGAVDSTDSLTTIEITSTSVNDVIEIRNNSLCTPVNRFNKVYSSIAVQMAGVTSGAVQLSTKLYYYGTPTYTTIADTGSTWKTTRALTYFGSVVGDAKNLTALLSVEGTPLVATNYIASQTFCEVGYQTNASILQTSPAIRLTGFVGKIIVKLPVYWIPKGTYINAFTV